MAHVSEIVNYTESWNSSDSDLIAIGIFEDKSLSGTGQEINKALDNKILSAVDLGIIKGKSGETAFFNNDKQRFLVVGLGKKEKFDLEEMRKAGGTVSRTAIQKKCSHVLSEVFGNETKDDFSQALSEGLILGSYQYLKFKTSDKDKFEIQTISILNGQGNGIKKGTLFGNGVCYARDLDNAPGNETTPTRLAEAAAEIAKEGDMKLTVFDREEFTEMGMGAFAGVAQGTGEPPKFIILEYYGGKNDEKPVALVGKGLTFDAGGISLKPPASMDEMKFDMCGSGIVLGVMKTIAALKSPINVVAVIPSTENLLGANAYKPGDIVKAYNGKTIEVLNTDAEGRLILADALSYVSKHYEPEFILDFATLTGAVVIALGHVATGIMGTNPDLIKRVKESSQKTGEKVWEFPLWDEYCEHIKSKIADIKNMGEPRQAGTIAGGAFLKEFVKEGIPWVHFDIAGTAWGGKEKSYAPKNSATGTIIRLVLDLLKV